MKYKLSSEALQKLIDSPVVFNYKLAEAIREHKDFQNTGDFVADIEKFRDIAEFIGVVTEITAKSTGDFRNVCGGDYEMFPEKGLTSLQRTTSMCDLLSEQNRIINDKVDSILSLYKGVQERGVLSADEIAETIDKRGYCAVSDITKSPSLGNLIGEFVTMIRHNEVTVAQLIRKEDDKLEPKKSQRSAVTSKSEPAQTLEGSVAKSLETKPAQLTAEKSEMSSESEPHQPAEEKPSVDPRKLPEKAPEKVATEVAADTVTVDRSLLHQIYNHLYQSLTCADHVKYDTAFQNSTKAEAISSACVALQKILDSKPIEKLPPR